MNLTNEEIKKLVDAAALLMQTFCEYKLAEDRLSTMNNLTSGLIKMGMDKETMASALQPYFKRLQDSQKQFYEELGVGEDNKEFWEWFKNEKMRTIGAGIDSFGIV